MSKAFLQRIVAFLLMVILLAYNIKTVSIIVDFKINQRKIAETLCVQKEDQQGCNGKCQLVKALKSDIETSKEMPIENIENIGLSFNYLQPESHFYMNLFYELFSSLDFHNTILNIINMEYEIVIPPPKTLF